MAKPSPYQITAFARSARERSFSRAARSLGVTQSSVTQHVANLERQMGAQLFVRRRDGLELTRAGRELFDVADRWVAINELVEERVADYTALDEGHLRISATAPRPALPLIARYNARYPKILIDFTLMNWTQNRAAVRDREVDIAIYTDPPIDDSVFAREIEQIRYRVFMRSDHRLAKRKSISLVDLQDETLVMTEDGSLTQRILLESARKHQISFPKTVKMTTFAVVKEAILHGLGVGVLLEDSVHQTQRLTSVPVRELDRVFRNYIVIPRDKENLRPIRRFVDLV
jgi:DNA-binding transcriptional LysR family regulator